MMEGTKNALTEEVENLRVQTVTQQTGSKLEEMAEDQGSKLRLRKLQAELCAI